MKGYVRAKRRASGAEFEARASAEGLEKLQACERRIRAEDATLRTRKSLSVYRRALIYQKRERTGGEGGVRVCYPVNYDLWKYANAGLKTEAEDIETVIDKNEH